jgi:hypothetical protein
VRGLTLLLLDVASPTPHGSVEPSLELEYAPPTCQATAPTSQGQYVDNPHSQVHVLAKLDAAAGGLIEGNSRRTTGTGSQTRRVAIATSRRPTASLRLARQGGTK